MTGEQTKQQRQQALSRKSQRQSRIEVLGFEKRRSSFVHRMERNQKQKKLIYILITVAILALLFVILDSKWFKNSFDSFVLGIKDHPILSIAIILVVYPICVCFLIPISQFHIILGFTYSEVFQDATKGFFFTIPITFVGTYLGALLSFCVARYILRKRIKQKMDSLKASNKWLENFDVIDEIMEEGNNGIYVVMMFRVIMLPFGLVNYCLGCLTSVSYIKYQIGSLACIVKVSLYTFIGASLYTITQDKDGKNNNSMIIAIELLISLMLTFWISFNAKWYLERKLDEKAVQILEDEQNAGFGDIMEEHSSNESKSAYDIDQEKTNALK